MRRRRVQGRRRDGDRATGGCRCGSEERASGAHLRGVPDEPMDEDGLVLDNMDNESYDASQLKAE